ncbi:6459_t:CDS:2, partial [Dentiscutata heterogama]
PKITYKHIQTQTSLQTSDQTWTELIIESGSDLFFKNSIFLERGSSSTISSSTS